MSQYHEMSKRKPSGGKANRAFKKKRSRIGSDPTLTVVGPKESKRTDRTRGANTKIRLKKGNTAQITDKKIKKTFKATIESVAENKANRLYVRRNIITKGAIFKTTDGKYAVVTSRPGQEGIIQAVLMTKEETDSFLKEKAEAKEKRGSSKKEKIVKTKSKSKNTAKETELPEEADVPKEVAEIEA